MPPRQPDYRQDRPHASFIANLPTTAEALKHALVAAWRAEPADHDWPHERVARAVAERYSRPEWNAGRA